MIRAAARTAGQARLAKLQGGLVLLARYDVTIASLLLVLLTKRMFN
jgi:hypothetical protein